MLYGSEVHSGLDSSALSFQAGASAGPSPQGSNENFGEVQSALTGQEQWAEAGSVSEQPTANSDAAAALEASLSHLRVGYGVGAGDLSDADSDDDPQGQASEVRIPPRIADRCFRSQLLLLYRLAAQASVYCKSQKLSTRQALRVYRAFLTQRTGTWKVSLQRGRTVTSKMSYLNTCWTLKTLMQPAGKLSRARILTETHSCTAARHAAVAISALDTTCTICCVGTLHLPTRVRVQMSERVAQDRSRAGVLSSSGDCWQNIQSGS